jgi:class 3 adenylate cyclase
MKEPSAEPAGEFSLRDHPWVKRAPPQGEPLDWRWRFGVSAPVDELWSILINSSRLNRAMGLPPVEYTEQGGVLHGAWVLRGLRYEWIEPPWEWVAGRTIRSVRIYSKGITSHTLTQYSVEPDGPRRSTASVRLVLYPINAAYRLLLHAGRLDFQHRFTAAFKALEEHFAAQRPRSALFAEHGPALPRTSGARLVAARARLVEEGVKPAVIDRLIELIRDGDDLDLHRIRVRPIARRFGVDESDLLLACLHATRAGVLHLSWDLLCPHCRGTRHSAKTLGEVPASSSCDACAIEFSTDFPEAIEITFQVNASIRRVPKLVYCLAEASSKAHVALQQTVEPGQSRRFETHLAPGRYRMRLHGEKRFRPLDIVENAPVRVIEWRTGGGRGGEQLAEELGPAQVAPSPEVTITNASHRQHAFIIEDVQWVDDAVRPAQLFNLQAFRDLFATEYLAADVQLSVGEQAILFSDIVGSTGFYETHGDAKAFAEVKRHFHEVYEEVKRHRGAVVKTIGDAAMAAFHDPLDALQAAAGLHRRFGAGKGSGLRIRITINVGSCIAVNLNSNIDYFGQAVNVAAKLQACVKAGQIVFPARLRADPRIEALLAAEQAHIEYIAFEMPSIARPIDVCRWDLSMASPDGGVPSSPGSRGFF